MLFKRTIFIRKNTLLLVRLDSIGDYILFRNFIQTVKESEKFKDYKITLCGNSWWKDLSEDLDKKYVNKFIWIDYDRMNNFWYRFLKHLFIYLHGYEIVIHPTYSRCTISDGVVIHSGAKIKIGNEGDTRNLSENQKKINDTYYTKLVSSYSDKNGFEFFRNKDFFEKLLAEKINLSRPAIPIVGKEEDTIVICPGAKGKNRQWSPINFSRLCALLAREFPKMKFVICGSRADSALAKRITEHSAVIFDDRTGKENLVQFTQTLAGAKLIITNDSGPFHIAVALDKKTLCISNGNNVVRFTPYPKEMKTHSFVFYPQEVLSHMNDKDFINELQNGDSTFDINSVTPEKVFETLINNERK